MADEPMVDDAPVQDSELVEVDDVQQEDGEVKPFEGEYDPERARRTIDKLRAENKELRKAKDAPVADPDKDRLAVENLQLRIALELGIPEKLATRLRGSTREELIEDAADLMDTVVPRREAPMSQQPRPRLKGGSQPDAEPELSAADIVAAATRR